MKALKSKITSLWNHAGLRKYSVNTGWLFVSKLISNLFSFFVTIFLVRYLLPEQLGLLNYAVSFVGLFSALANLGLDSVVQRELVRFSGKHYELFGSIFVLKLIGSISAFILIIISTFFIDASLYGKAIILVIGFSHIFNSLNLVNFYYLSTVNAKYLAIGNVATAFSMNCLKLLLILTGASLIWFAIILMIEPLIYVLFSGIRYFKMGFRMSKWTFSPELARSLLKDSWPMAFVIIFTVIYSRIDQIMIKSFMDFYSVGLYGAVTQLSEYWLFVPATIIVSVTPAIVRSSQVGGAYYRRKIAYLFVSMLAASLAVALALQLFSSSIINLVYGASYLPASTALKIYAWSGIGSVIGIIVNLLAVVENKTKINFISTALGAIVNVALNIVWIPKFGINGAALATLVAYSLVPAPYLAYKLYALRIAKNNFSN